MSLMQFAPITWAETNLNRESTNNLLTKLLKKIALRTTL
jgi:hypothetical protein